MRHFKPMIYEGQIERSVDAVKRQCKAPNQYSVSRVIQFFYFKVFSVLKFVLGFLSNFRRQRRKEASMSSFSLLDSVMLRLANPLCTTPATANSLSSVAAKCHLPIDRPYSSRDNDFQRKLTLRISITPDSPPNGSIELIFKLYPY